MWWSSATTVSRSPARLVETPDTGTFRYRPIETAGCGEHRWGDPLEVDVSNQAVVVTEIAAQLEVGVPSEYGINHVPVLHAGTTEIGGVVG